MTDKQVHALLSTIALQTLRNSIYAAGSFYEGRINGDASYYAEKAELPLVQLVPYVIEDDFDNGTFTIDNCRLLFIGKEPRDASNEQLLDVINEMGIISRKFFQSLSKWNYQGLHLIEIQNVQRRKMYKMYDARLTGYEASFSIKGAFSDCDTMLDEALEELLINSQ